MSFKKSMLAVLTVILLIAVAVVVPVTNTGASASTGIQGISNDDDSFEFNGYNKTTSGDVDVYRMSEIVQTEKLFGYIPDGYGTTTSVSAVVTVNNEMRLIGFDVGLLSGGKVMMTHSESISSAGIESNDAWLMDEILMISGGTAQTMNVVAYVQESWDLIQMLQDLLPKVSSSVIKEKVETMLAKAVVKRIITAAASAVIPGIGWAIAIISLGLAAYDLYQLNGELRELVELARVDVAGCIYDPDTKSMKVAQRYGGNNDNSWIPLTSINDSDPSSKDGQKFFLAYVDVSNHEVLVSNVEIIEQHALSIMSISSTDKIPEGDGLSVYTVNKNDAKRIAQSAAGSSSYPDTDNRFHHTTLHQNADSGLKHYHHALHDGEKYPAHSFYGAHMTA